ncbi:MAG: class I SAM-dependent methyltransferase [Bradymonadia bacterium]
MDAIEQFYHRHPYPQVDRVEFDLTLIDRLFYQGRRCGRHHAPIRSGASFRLLVAGCGTREAVMWALCAPNAQVDAVDLSADSIAIARHLAEQLGIADRITFTQGDLASGVGMSGQYDMISSFGVLHHLPDPGAGLATLRSHLAPHGVMALMMYTHTNRRPLQEARRVVELLTGEAGLPVESTPRLTSAALSLCQIGAGQPNRLQHVFQSGLRDHAVHPAQFADTLLNPREVSYSIPEFVELLDAHNLELLGPVNPSAWKPLSLIPPDQHEAFLALPMIEQMEIADLLTSPLLWALVGHPEPIQRPCDDDEALFWRRVPLPLEAGHWPVNQLRVEPRPQWAGIQCRALEQDRVTLTRDPRYPQVYHKVAQAMVAGIDGKRTLEELSIAAAESEGTEFPLIKHTLAKYWRRMLDEQGFTAIDLTRCDTCPHRCAPPA